MPALTPADEYFVHQLPEPLPNVVTWHEHWRESVFFVMHQDHVDSDVVIATMATYPVRQVLDSYQMGRIGGQLVFGLHERPYDGDPQTMVTGPLKIDITEPYKTALITASGPTAPVQLDLTFTARTPAYGLRRGTMKYRHETVWDQSHMVQSGTFNGWYEKDGNRVEVVDWIGQRDHSWGIREHDRCPLWIWLAIQFPEGMLAVWHWEYANGARVYTDGCWSPCDGSDPIPVIDFRHDGLHWTGEDGSPVSYGRDGLEVRGLAGPVEFTLEGGQKITLDGQGAWAMPYGGRGGGQFLMDLTTDDGRRATAIYEVTGVHHHKFFPEPRGERLPPG